eukprot:403358249
MSHSANNKACCFPYLSFKKQTNALQVNDKNKSAQGLNDLDKLNRALNNQNLKKTKVAELQQCVGNFHEQIKTNKIVPQIQIKKGYDSPSFNDQTTIRSAMSKCLNSESQYPAISSGFSSMYGSPITQFRNFKYVQNFKEDCLNADNDQSQQSKFNNFTSKQKQFTQQKPIKSRFYQNQQDKGVSFGLSNSQVSNQLQQQNEHIEQGLVGITSSHQKSQNIGHQAKLSNLDYQTLTQNEAQVNTYMPSILQSSRYGVSHLLEEIEQIGLEKLNNQLKDCQKRKILKISLNKEQKRSMIKRETQDIVEGIFMDFNLAKFQNIIMIIDPSHLEKEDESIEGEERLEDQLLQNDEDYNSSSSSLQQHSLSSSCSLCNCSDSSKSISNSSIDESILQEQNFQAGKINLKNNSNYSIYMNDHSQSRNHNDESSICRFGSGKYQNAIKYNNNSIDGYFPQVVSPQNSQRQKKGDANQVIQRSPILQEKFSISSLPNNQELKLQQLQQFEQDKNNNNNNKQQISEECAKLPYFQSLCGKNNSYNLQSSKKSTEASHLNSSSVYQDIMNINDKEFLMESVSSLDLQEELC